MIIDQSIFKAYDIRGIYPSQLNETATKAIIRTVVEFFQTGNEDGTPLKMVLGRDMRLSSPALHQVAIDTLTKLGVNVIDIGLVSTPSLYYAVRFYGADGGIQISASHNPKDYNGLKMVKNSPKGLIKIGKSTGMDQIKELAVKYSELPFEPVEKPGSVETINTDELLAEEIQNAKKIAGFPEIKHFKIVADAANAMGAGYLTALFRDLPADLITMNFELDGTFPSHAPDPLVLDNLKDIRAKVVEEGADLGLATDGDGDRLMFIDEKGDRVDQSIIIALVARELLRENPGEKILYDIRYIFTPKTVIKEHGGQPVMTRVGHAFITQQMNEEGGIFGGESSGHNFFRDTGNAESQLPVVLLVLKALTRENKSLSKLAQELKRSYESEELNFRVRNAPELIEMLEKEFGVEGEIEKIDGVAISFTDWRFLVRPSNTEPILRLTVEELGADAKGDKKTKLIEFINQNADFAEEEGSH